MALSVNSSGTTAALTIGTETTVGAAVTSANVFELNLDVSNLAGGATPDILEVREYTYVKSGGIERQLAVYTLTGVQTSAAFKTPARISPVSIRYSVKQTQGTGRTFDWGIFQTQ